MVPLAFPGPAELVIITVTLLPTIAIVVLIVLLARRRGPAAPPGPGDLASGQGLQKVERIILKLFDPAW